MIISFIVWTSAVVAANGLGARRDGDTLSVAAYDRRAGTAIWMIVDSATGLQIRVKPPLSVDRDVVWSPDGTRALFRDATDSRLNIYDITTHGLYRASPEYGTCHSWGQGWAPDGDQIAFLCETDPLNPGSSGLHVAGYTAQTDRVLMPQGAYSNYVWSPDSRTIALSTTESILLFDVVTGARNEVMTSSEALLTPYWSPDGQRLTVTEMADPPRVMLLEGDDLRELHSGDLAETRWMPDASRYLIADPAGVLVYDMDEGTMETVSLPLDDLQTAMVVFRPSPEGRRLVILGTQQVHLASLDDPTAISSLPTTPLSVPVWARDGRRFAFLEGYRPLDTSQSGQKLVVLTLDDGGLHRLELDDVTDFAWSPEGDDIMVARRVVTTRRDRDARPRELVTVDLETGRQRVLLGDDYEILSFAYWRESP